MASELFWINQPGIRWPLTALYLLILALIALYGLHRYWMLWVFRRTRFEQPRPRERFTELPAVTIQLPMFNEAAVAARVIDAACRIDYPADRLQIQVLDDSTDACAAISRQCVEAWRDRGVNISYHHRSQRTGYKAGALADALPEASGAYIAIFDADFVPPANFLRRTIHHFTDPTVGMVQARWGHLNREQSLLTRSQAVYLDGHFIIEHAARHRSGRYFNFNGTAGVWRRRTILAAGGWQHDTLTEDLDLSYRAQMAGWRFVYLTRLVCPAELPPEIAGFKSQQHRWTKGSIQTALKLLPRLMRSEVPWTTKLEACFHLTSPMVYLYVTLLALLLYPALCVNMLPADRSGAAGVLLGLTLLVLGTLSASLFYLASQRAQRRSGWRTIALIPVLMSIGVGIALTNARACLEALVGYRSGFVRTPKYNVQVSPRKRGGEDWPPAGATPEPLPASAAKPAALKRTALVLPMLELAMGLYTLACARLALTADSATLVCVPFLILFSTGYLYVGLTGLVHLSTFSHQANWQSSHFATAAQSPN